MRTCVIASILLFAMAMGVTSSSSDTLHSLHHRNASSTVLSSQLEVTSKTLLNANTPTGSTNFLDTLTRARQKALAGGLSGFIAGAVQVVTLMWLRTTVNYQYRYGVSMMTALRELNRQGGIYRFYRGLPYAIIQGPLARFGGIAANDASIVFAAYLTGQSELMSKGVLSTALGSILAGLWRVFLMPIDTCKTVLQVDGARGFRSLSARVKRGEISALYSGSVATVVATMASHYPWFIVHNILDKYFTVRIDTAGLLLRSAVIGFCASAVSDTLSNSIRVVKTVKQVSAGEFTDAMSYRAVILKVHAESGLKGLFGRGLLTRILTNGLQSMLFTVIWKLMSRKRGATSTEGKDVKEESEKLGARKTPTHNLRQSK